MTRLILRQHKEHGRKEDLDAIRALLHAKTPDLRVSICGKRLGPMTRFRNRPATLISFPPYRGPRPSNIKVICGQMLSKAEECQALQDAGLPVPRWALWVKGKPAPDLSGFGPYAVRKPNLGGRGANIKIVRTSRVRWKALEVKYASLHSDPFFQEFIYTGRYPVCFRVGVLFGEPIYRFKITASEDRHALSARFNFKQTDDKHSFNIVANSRSSTYSDFEAPEIIELAREAHRAFPEVPLLGVDILRDAETQKLWIIEVNASGYTWHFSSSIGKGIQETHHIDLKKQLGGLERAAEIIGRRFG